MSVSHRGNLTPRLGSSSNKFVFDYSKANHTSRFEDKNGYQTERISRVLNVNKSNAKTEPDVKEFYHKQTKLHEELSNLKSEMQNIAESISIPKVNFLSNLT